MNLSSLTGEMNKRAKPLTLVNLFFYQYRMLVFFLLTTLMILIGCVRIASTYDVYWQTWDEPFHIAAGLEWLDRGKFTYEPYHPPLARIMTALGPYLAGVRLVDGTSTWPPIVYQGNSILYTPGNYERNLTLARIGILPFFILASAMVAVLAKFYGGIPLALLATLLFTSLPPFLAHSGFATLDVACAALVATTLYCLILWLKRPSFLYSALLGISLGLAALSKLQALGFLLAAGFLTIVVFWLDTYKGKKLTNDVDIPKLPHWFVSLIIATLLCTLTIWAVYRFSVGHILRVEDRPHEKIDRIVGSQGIFHNTAYFILENTPIPAPEFKIAIQDFFIKNNQGHLDYFLGEIRENGWWYYFPIILLLKTPLPFIMLSFVGFYFILWNVFRAKHESILILIPLLTALGFLAVSTLGKHNNGIRQILSIYPFLAVVAGYGGLRVAYKNQRFHLVGLGVVTFLVLWQLVSSFASHPNYLVYFNELARNHPEKIAVDSDLDWGQDLKRLSLTLRDRGVEEVKIKYHGSVGLDLTQFNLPRTRELVPYKRETGWIAISIYSLTLGTGQSPYDQFSWLNEFEPLEKIGDSIWLYYIPKVR